MKKTRKTLKSILSFALATAMTASLAVLPVQAADSVAFTMNPSLVSEWQGRADTTVKTLDQWQDANGKYPTVAQSADGSGAEITFPAGYNRGETVDLRHKAAGGAGGTIYQNASHAAKFEFDVNIPSNVTKNINFMNFTYTNFDENNSGGIYGMFSLSVRDDITSGKTGLYVKTRSGADWETTAIKEADTIDAIAGWNHIKLLADYTNKKLIIYNGNEIVGIKSLNKTHPHYMFAENSVISYFGFIGNGVTEETTFGVKNFTITNMDRGAIDTEITENMTSGSNKLHIDFKGEPMSQTALDTASVKITDASGAQVSGASASLVYNSDNTADMTITGLQGLTQYTATVDVYTAAARAAQFSHTFTTAKVYADTAIAIQSDLSQWQNSGWNYVYNNTDLGAYVISDTNGIGIVTKAGKNSSNWSSGLSILPYKGQDKKPFDGKTLLTEFDVTIPNNDLLVGQNFFIIKFCRKNPVADAKGGATAIKVGIRNKNSKYELYVVDDEYGMVNKYATVATADTFAGLVGKHHIKFAVDTSKMVIATYAEDGSVNYITGIGDSSINHDLRFYSDTQIYTVSIGMNNAKGATDETIYFNNLSMKTLERGLTATFKAECTSDKNVIKATFEEAVAQAALNKAAYKVTQNGEAVSGAVVTAKSTGEKTAEFTIEGLSGQTAYTLSIDNVFTVSGRTSDGALSTSFTTSKVYADSTVLDGSNGTIWTNSYETVQNDTCDIYATNTENGEIVVHVKAGAVSGWVSGKVLVVGGKRNVAIQSKTTLFDFDLEIPDDETFALANQYLTLSIKGTGQNENGNIVVGLRKNNDKYQLYLRLYVDAGNYEYYTIAEADTFDGIKGWHDVKFAIDTKKYMLAVYNENGTVAYRKNLDKINNDLKLSDSSVLNYAAIFPKNSADTEKTIKYRNLVVKGLDRAFTADASTVAKSTQFSTTVTFDTPVNTADIEKFVTVARKDGAEHAVSPVIAVTPVSETEAVITVSKLSTNTAYTLTLDGLFNNDLRTSNGALVSADVTTTKSDTICIEGTPTVTKDASGFSAAVTYKNVSSVEQTFWTAVALYKSNGEIVALEYMDISLGAGESVSKNFAETVDCSEAVQAEVFVWDSIDTMNALQKHESISLN